MNRRTPAVAAALSLPALAYGAVIRLRNAWYDRPSAVTRASVPVISIGNLAVGGTGKTPLVAWVARRIHDLGIVPAVVSRGYGGNAGPGPLLVSTGSGPRVNARACGDEPHLLARSLEGTVVVVGSDRIEGSRAAAGAGAGAVILDDGFQHRRLARDLDIVVLDGRAPFDDGRLLPQGNLREPPSALSRAHLVVLTRLKESDRADHAIAAVRATTFSGPIVRSGHTVVGFHDAAGALCDAPAEAVTFCGIGDPELFRADLLSSGVSPARFHAFRDHQPYTVAGWNALAAEARALGVPLLTTEKDFSRLEAAVGASLGSVSLIVMKIESAVWDAAPLLAAVTKCVTVQSRPTASRS